MNKDRRKRLSDIIAKLEVLQSEIQSLAEEERECFDNMPEGLQESERGSAIEDNADDLDETDSDFESLLDTLNDIMER